MSEENLLKRVMFFLLAMLTACEAKEEPGRKAAKLPEVASNVFPVKISGLDSSNVANPVSSEEVNGFQKYNANPSRYYHIHAGAWPYYQVLILR